MATIEELKIIARGVMKINHVAIECGDPLENENLHLLILKIDKLARHEAVRLLTYIIHVQQLQLAGAKIVYDPKNPFRDMINFEYLDSNIKSYPPRYNISDLEKEIKM